MSERLSLSVFFPAYNEEANIAQSVSEAEAVLKTVTNTYEIIIVNDGSKDRTGAIADELAEKNKHVRVVHHSPNQGYGAAVLAGMRAARYEYIFFTDADLQFNLEELKQLLQYIPEYEVVIGYRAKRRDPFMRLVNAKGWNILNRFLFGLRVHDIDCAFKLFRRSVVQDLPVKSRGAMMSAELLIRLQRKGIKFKEVPVTHLPRKFGSPTGAKPSVIFRAFKELFQTYRGELGSVTHRQLAKFAMVGVVNTILDLALYVILTRTTPYFADHLVITKALTFALASIFSFAVNRKWTFRRTTPIQLRELIRFYLTVGSALIINAASLFVLLRIFAGQDILAAIFATCASFVWNFTFSKLWVFRQREQRSARFALPAADALILLSLIGLVALNGFFWLRADNYPPHWDMANHLRHSLAYTDAFLAINETESPRALLRSIYYFFIDMETYYPPFVYWLSVPFVLVFGRNFDAITASNSILLVVYTFSLYGIGLKLWNRATGLLTALVGLSFPFIVGQFHEFQLDMPLTVLAATGLWILLQTNKFQHPGWSFAFGAITGFGMLTKWPFPAFIIGPAIYLAIVRFIELRQAKAHWVDYRALAYNLALAGLGLFLTAGPWYFTNLESLKRNLLVNWETGTGEGDPPPLSAKSLRLYSDVLIQAQLRLLLLIPFVIGLLTTLLNRQNLRRNLPAVAMIVGGYVIMTLYNNKDYRFIEPILPAIAVISAYWIIQLIRPWRQIATGYMVAVFAFHLITISWGQQLVPFLPKTVYSYVPDIQGGEFRLTVWDFTGYGSGPPRNENWHQLAFLHTIHDDGQAIIDQGRQIRLAMYYKDNMEFNRENMLYYIYREQLPIRLLDSPPATFNCTDVDYVIATTRAGVAAEVSRDFPYYQDYAYPLHATAKRTQTPGCELQELKRVALPDTTEAFLWKVIR